MISLVKEFSSSLIFQQVLLLGMEKNFPHFIRCHDKKSSERKSEKLFFRLSK
jgi:hypothetical protein